MTAPELYHEATKRGLRLAPAGDRLAVIPKGKCPPDFANTLREHKAELLEWLSRSPCPGWQAVPPADLPLNPLMPRPTPARREAVIAYLLRQTGDRPSPLAAWLVRRENAYYDGPGRTWDCGLICYGAARDTACWQLSRGESEVWQFLEATAEAYQFKGSGE
jgi:hypothetical protein